MIRYFHVRRTDAKAALPTGALLVAALALAGCQTPTPAASDVVTSATLGSGSGRPLTVAPATVDPAMATAEAVEFGPCGRPAPGHVLLTLEEHGYCLHHPAEFGAETVSVEDTAALARTVLSGPGSDSGSPPRAVLEVWPAEGRSTADAAELIAAAAAARDQYAMGSPVTLGGESAMRLAMPGDAPAWIVVVVRDDRLMRLTFQPADPAAAADYARMHNLYEAVTRSLTFLN